MEGKKAGGREGGGQDQELNFEKKQIPFFLWEKDIQENFTFPSYFNLIKTSHVISYSQRILDSNIEKKIKKNPLLSWKLCIR